MTSEEPQQNSNVDLSEVKADSTFNIEVQPENARSIWEQIAPHLKKDLKEQGPDTLWLMRPVDEFKIDTGGTTTQLPSGANFRFGFKTTFFPTEEGIFCSIAGEELLLGVDFAARPDFAKMSEAFSERNRLAGFISPVQPKTEPKAESGIYFPHVLKLPNGAAERDLHRAMMMLPEWNRNENLMTRYHDGREKTTVVYQPPELLEALQSAPEKAMRALDDRFNKIKSELTADVIDILFHHWKHNKIEAHGGRAGITLTKICEYRGVEPRNENLENAWHAMRDARSIRLTGNGISAALFEMDSIDFQSPGIPHKDTAYFYMPGFFVQFGLDQNKLYYAPFLQDIWKLDPYRNAEAKRLARFLRGEWRLNEQTYTSKDGKKRWRTWRQLLAEMGVFPDQWKAEGRKVSREIEGIEKALQTLYDLEFLAEVGEAIYHPDDCTRSSKLPRKGRLEAWLELRVCLSPAADIADALAEGRAQRIAQQERDSQALAKAKAQKKLRSQSNQGRGRKTA